MARSSTIPWDSAPRKNVQFVNWYRKDPRGKTYRYVQAGMVDGVYAPKEGWGNTQKYGYWLSDEDFEALKKVARADWKW